jgi:hypothetical protein
MFARAALIAVAMLPGPIAADDVIVPTRSVGVIQAGVSETALRTALPEGQVRRRLRQLGEGYAVCSTEIYAGTPRSMLVDWANGVEYDLSEPGAEADCLSLADRVEPTLVTIELTTENAPIWRTAEGIGVGMTLTDLADLLGRPVDFFACPCDYGGFISNEEETLPAGLSLSVRFPVNTDHTLAEFVNPKQDYRLSSSHIPPEMSSEFVVDQISVEINP